MEAVINCGVVFPSSILFMSVENKNCSVDTAFARIKNLLKALVLRTISVFMWMKGPASNNVLYMGLKQFRERFLEKKRF